MTVVAGVALAGGLELVPGANLLTFALLLLTAVTIGQWRRLRGQGAQVATAAAFAYGAIAASGMSTLSEITLSVLIGAVPGLAAIALLAPPTRHRSAGQGVYDLAAARWSSTGDRLRPTSVPNRASSDPPGVSVTAAARASRGRGRGSPAPSPGRAR